MTLAANALENLKVLEVFPQTQIPQHFAEFGEKLPQKLKSGINFFLLQVEAEPEPAPTPEPEETPTPPAPQKKRRKKATDDVPTEEPEAPTVPEKKPVKRRAVSVGDVSYKLYLKASQDGVLGKKGEMIEAQKIPAGATIHLVKRKKYIKTVIYYEGTWSDLK